MAHQHAGAPCPHPTKKACDLARKVEMGQCTAMVDGRNEPHPCTHWAIEKIDERGYCGQHLNSVVLAKYESDRKTRIVTEMNDRIDAYMTWRNEHPSVWDRMVLP
jgi:hypothetical protein